MGHINTDIPELKGYDTGVVLGNLERLCHRVDMELNTVVAHLYELAEAIRRDSSGDIETAHTILRALAVDEPAAPPSAGSSPSAFAARLLPRMGLYERLTLYRAVVEMGMKSSDAPRKSSDRRALVSAMAQGRIAYMPNAFADQAYGKFSGYISSMRGKTLCRAVHCHGFAEGCEEVSRGQCEYCILPVESSLDGKLPGFARLMVEQGLFTVAVCDVENRTLPEKNVTRFALLASLPREKELLLGEISRRAYLEALHTASSVSLTDLMVAADFCGLIPSRVDTLPMADGSLPVSVVWDTRQAQDVDLSVFLVFLLLEASDDRVMGLYDQI